MRKYLFVCLLSIFTMVSQASKSQGETNVADSTSSLVLVETYAGGEFVGKLLIDNEKVVVIQTKDRGKVEIPKYEIEKISKVSANEISAKGEYIPDQVFATRYFISTNGLPIKKGESYALFNLWGPDVSFGVADNLSLGVMTTWLAIPIIATAKYSIALGGKNSMALGLLAGHTVWSGNAGGVLPFAAYTYGTRKSNFTISGGYARVFAPGESAGSAIFSVAGMRHISKNISLVFDSWIMPDIDGTSFALLMPGLRFQSKNKNAFQFGFTGAIVDGETLPVPLPMVQWYRKF